MIFEASQDFRLPFPGDEASALAFLRDPGRSLSRVRFLRGLSFDGTVVRAELIVNVPMMGEVTLPFESEVVPTPRGARLVPRELSGRAWAAVDGDGDATDGELRYRLTLRAHLDLPGPEKWGGAAFEKMFHAAAARTLDRVARDFPEGVRAAASE
ncbi:DUF3809 domain-containing protein [Deinococcus pimensis]|uniref:DUF3809 domain-containing protein n=1 Tax=Deinococcus pimensis TaxID=309888 RepID=UPI000481D6F0|nr:DUF3809 domain-containing protein [Deinococcus pimensis]